MVQALLPFPHIDPVLVSLGPFAIRWYALAYICGILLGWLYARALIRNERLWGGPAPLTLLDFDDFVIWVTLGILLVGHVLGQEKHRLLSREPPQVAEAWRDGDIGEEPVATASDGLDEAGIFG